jgi:hypothetical protein
MTPEQITAMRAYVRQWIMGPDVWHGPSLADLRAQIDVLTSRNAIDRWLKCGSRLLHRSAVIRKNGRPINAKRQAAHRAR